jgi:hypothetical protein
MARWGAAGRRPRSPPPATERPTARRPGHSNASQALPRQLTQELAAAERQTCSPGWRRDARPARRTTAQRTTTRHGGFPSPTCRSTLIPKRRQHRDVTTWGSLDPRLPLARRGTASPMGRRRRGALGQRRLDGTRTGRTTMATGARRGEGRPRCSPWVGGVGVAGLAWVAAQRRCPRRRSIPCSGPAPLRSRTAPPPRPAPHELVLPPQQRAGGGARRFPTSPPLPHFPLLLPPPMAALRRGKNPNVGWWRGQLLLALLSLLLNPRRREVMANSRNCPGSVRPAAAAAPHAQPSLRATGKATARGGK